MKTFLIGIFFSACTLFASAAEVPESHQVGADNMPVEIAPIRTPFEMVQPVRPEFPNVTVNIAKKGARQGKLCTKVIQKTIDELSQKGGGTILIPSGIDVDSSRNVLIEYSTLDCGDDCFTIKAGRGDDG